MKCYTCGEHIPIDSKTKMYLGSKVFCGRRCLDRFNEKEARIRAKRLKLEKEKRQQRRLM